MALRSQSFQRRLKFASPVATSHKAGTVPGSVRPALSGEILQHLQMLCHVCHVQVWRCTQLLQSLATCLGRIDAELASHALGSQEWRWSDETLECAAGETCLYQGNLGRELNSARRLPRRIWLRVCESASLGVSGRRAECAEAPGPSPAR